MNETYAINLVCIKCRKPYSPDVCKLCRADRKAHLAMMLEKESKRRNYRYNRYKIKEVTEG